MRIADGFLTRKVGADTVIIAIGERAKTFQGMVKMNETAKDIWNWVKEGLTEEEIAKRLAQEYDVDPETAAKDTAAILDEMEKQGFLER